MDRRAIYTCVSADLYTAPAFNYQPTPPAELRRVALWTAPQSDLIINADRKEIDPSVDGDQTEPPASSSKNTQQTSVTVASATVKPDAASSSREKRTIDVPQYGK